MSFNIDQCSESLEFVAVDDYGYVYVHVSLLDFVDQFIEDGTEDTSFQGQYKEYDTFNQSFTLNLVFVYDDNWKDRFSENSMERYISYPLILYISMLRKVFIFF